MIKIVKQLTYIFKNKNILYLLTRYFTYGIQFLVSIYIAISLGPYYFGIWGFILLLINYFAIFDFGIANAVNLLIIQNKDNQQKVERYFTTGLIFVSVLNFLVGIFFLYNFFYPLDIFIKFDLTGQTWLICLIVMNINYSNLLMHLFRINNKLSQISFYQSVVPILLLIAVFVFEGESLLNNLILCYVFGNILSLIFFVSGKILPVLRKPKLTDLNDIFKRGFFLFLYNVSFYLIILSLRSFISAYYSIEEFGLFSFAFTLGNSILLFLQAISFLIYPKVVSVLNKLENDKVLESLRNLRRIYLTLTYLMLFIGLLITSVGIEFVPKYINSFKMIGLCSLTIVLYSNSFGYGTYLISKGHERINALISISCLMINIVICYILITYLRFPYELVIFATMVAYFIYTYLTVYFTKRNIGFKSQSIMSNLLDCFGINILVPYLISLVLIVFNYKSLTFVPLVIFILLSKRDILFLLLNIKKILYNKNFLKI